MRPNAATGLAGPLLAYEAENAATQERGNGDPNPSLSAEERVFEKLRLHLSRRVGGEGYRTLVSRALNLATAAHPALRAVLVREDARLEGLTPDARTDSPPEVAVALMEELLGLLVTFIGDDLTLRMVRTVWLAFSIPSEDPQIAAPEEDKL